MKKRPLTVTIVCWFFIISGALNLAAFPIMRDSPFLRRVFVEGEVDAIDSFILSLATSLIYLIAGFAMLNRQRWGRQIYLVLAPIILLLSIYLLGLAYYASELLRVILYGIILVLLIRKDANDYFTVTESKKSSAPIAESQASGGRKVIAAIFLLLGGFLLALWLINITEVASLKAFLFGSVLLWIFISLFVVSGIFLWGKHQWVLLAASLMMIAGIFDLFLGALIQSVLSSSYFGAGNDVLLLPKLSQSGYVIGAVSFIIGLAIFLLRRWRGGVDASGTD